jgi:hypothetical protein
MTDSSESGTEVNTKKAGGEIHSLFDTLKMEG